MDTYGYCRARQHGYHFPLTTGTAALAAGQLDTVGGVKHDGAAGFGLHHRQRAHIGHQVVVAKTDPTLTHHDVLITGGLGFLDHMLHIPGRQKLALLDIHWQARSRHTLDKTRLPTQKRRRLQH